MVPSASWTMTRLSCSDGVDIDVPSFGSVVDRRRLNPLKKLQRPPGPSPRKVCSAEVRFHTYHVREQETVFFWGILCDVLSWKLLKASLYRSVLAATVVQLVIGVLGAYHDKPQFSKCDTRN